MHRRIMRTAWAVKIGLVIPLVLLAAAVAFGGPWSAFNRYGLLVGAVVAMAGILSSRTVNPAAHLESFD